MPDLPEMPSSLGDGLGAFGHQPQWPFMPAIQGQVPLPKPDPRSAMVKALMTKQPMPMPRPDPRDWATRAIEPKLQSEDNSLGAIHPDALMKARGVEPPTGHSIDLFQHEQHPIGMSPSQMPLGMQPPIRQQDAGNGIFGVPNNQLQHMAGDVVPFPKPPPVTWDEFMNVNKQGQTRGTLEKALGMPSTVVPLPLPGPSG